MATYASLTQSQKDTLKNALDLMARPELAEFVKVLNHMSAFKSLHDAGAAAILATLDPAEVIPNQSGLAGAGDMTALQWTNFVSAIYAILTTYNTGSNRQNIALAAGGANLIGGQRPQA